MTYVGIMPNGTELLLPPPVSVKLVSGEDAPADGFTGVFPFIGGIGEMTGIRIYNKNQKLIFNGIVDEQKENCGVKRTLTLIARSRAALLLDNEAVPQTYCMPSLDTVFSRHIKPYGFSSFRGENRMFGGELTVTKGMSEWQVAEAFCTRFLKVRPRVRDNVFDASGGKPQGNILFDHLGGVGCSSVCIDRQYCRYISEVLMKSGKSGGYSLASQDDMALSLGIRRRRCMGSSGGNADDVIKTARRKAFQVTVVCPGEVEASLFMGAQVRDAALGNLNGLYVSQIEYSLDSNGENSRFVLRR